jgi:DNA-binding CsgD family transcriptional regulator
MIQLAIIVVIIISLVAAMYGIILLGSLRKKYQIEFLNSFFYYHILYFLFGFYGILGNLTVQQILLKFDFKASEIGSIALFFPFFGVPFILAAWYLFIKLSAELINKKVPQYVAIGYFAIATSVFLVYGRSIQIMPNLDYRDLTQKVIIVFYTIDLIVSAYCLFIMFISSLRQKMNSKRIFLLRFGILAVSLSTLRALSMQFSHYHWIIGLYFLVLFFAGNLSLIMLTKVYLSNYNTDYQTIQSNIDDIYLKYGISNREKEIIFEICKGKTNQQIADDLFISLQTVKDHTYNIFRKVDVKNRVQLTKIFTNS